MQKDSKKSFEVTSEIDLSDQAYKGRLEESSEISFAGSALLFKELFIDNYPSKEDLDGSSLARYTDRQNYWLQEENKGIIENFLENCFYVFKEGIIAPLPETGALCRIMEESRKFRRLPGKSLSASICSLQKGRDVALKVESSSPSFPEVLDRKKIFLEKRYKDYSLSRKFRLYATTMPLRRSISISRLISRDCFIDDIIKNLPELLELPSIMEKHYSSGECELRPSSGGDYSKYLSTIQKEGLIKTAIFDCLVLYKVPTALTLISQIPSKPNSLKHSVLQDPESIDDDTFRELLIEAIDRLHAISVDL